MDFITNLLNDFGTWILIHRLEISVAIVATALIIFGEDVNSFVRRLLKPYHIIIRFIGFVALCTLGYGFLTVFLAHQLSLILGRSGVYTVIIITLVAFILLALFASRRRKI